MAHTRNENRNSISSRNFESKWGRGVALTLLLSAFSGFATADAACDAEIALVNAEIAAREDSSSQEVQRAKQLLQVLAEDCEAGATLDSVESLSNMIREVLGMEARS
ncbi:hypothetical protein [uncultured Microbulbifer sp.]|uniref:hypothetical protein n=1 Tax=uncultured Microbulbifer sp. TaxID=348147 RepID=UPI0025D02470|nr:hypothetical protein [uncultured Microbulbifer sp.]